MVFEERPATRPVHHWEPVTLSPSHQHRKLSRSASSGFLSGVEMDMRMTNQRNTRDAVFEQAYPKSALSILH